MTRVHKKGAHLLNSTCMPSEWWQLETETASNPVLYALLIPPLPFPTQIHLCLPEGPPNTWQSSGSAQSTAFPLTFFSSLLLRPVNVVLELDADLPLVGLVSDEGVLHQLLRRRSLAVVLHQAALNERLKLFRPGRHRKTKANSHVDSCIGKSEICGYLRILLGCSQFLLRCSFLGGFMQLPCWHLAWAQSSSIKSPLSFPMHAPVHVFPGAIRGKHHSAESGERWEPSL